MKKISVIMICLMCIILNSCKKETLPDTPIVGLGGDYWVPGALDAYIKTNFTDPLNIEVKYKWDPWETKYNKNMAPVDEAVVIPVLEATQKIWIQPYQKLAGMEFMRQLAPKQLVLIGSAEYNSDGTITLGEAEGGKRISLLVANSYDRKNAPIVKQMLHTINHEFGHILHQNINYPRDFKKISEQYYTSSWFNTTNVQANAQGLVTAYAKVGADDDWVETIAYLLVEGQTAFDAMVAANPGYAATTLRTKEAMVVDYYRTAYKIDFRALQAEIKAAFIAISQ
ncbi:substrate import-associated zinc metallohydrolase lipoprotein [Pedobacter sp. MC2016-24]|uniref:substrate import-associated zinc metallohydrolase lipoprotein n=1 Tax=Pedobacter sp. MC2016-24 TaxID=2780090 RepID=UPI0018824850|nr:substrate import-associated zinc metallohydrolase lipoprotein [Pedobacter sp. MC2016-24]MBE9598962.1 hypothetical protein [Pedobacter sp. MC2016-24]